MFTFYPRWRSKIQCTINLWKSQHSHFCECHEGCDRATDWTILNSIKLTTYYLIIWFLRCLTLVQSVAPRQICAEIICLHVDLLALGSFMHANGHWKTLHTFSFTDFRDVVSELANYMPKVKWLFLWLDFLFFMGWQWRQVC